MKKVDSDSGVSRRGLIRAGLSALAAGLLLKFVGANSVTVERVEGANGNAIIIGQGNSGSSTTTLGSAVSNGPNAFFDNNGGTGDAQAIQGRVTGTSGRAFVGFASGTAGSTIAMDGVCNSPDGVALRGANTSTGWGIQASSNGAFIAKFQNTNPDPVHNDHTAIIEWETGDMLFTSYSAGVAGSGNGLGLTAGQFYIERVGAGAHIILDYDPGTTTYYLLPGHTATNIGKTAGPYWRNIHLGSDLMTSSIEILGSLTEIYPSTDATGSLGLSNKRWNDLYIVNSHVGDLGFANQFRVIEDGVGGLAFVNAKNEKIAILDSQGNFAISGKVVEQQSLGVAAAAAPAKTRSTQRVD